MTDDRTHGPRRAIRRLAVAGGAVIGLFAGTVAVWALTASLTGAVVASGQFVVDGHVKKVQHPTGGIVGALSVREGYLVTQGQVVPRLDDTIPRASLQMVSQQLDELATRRTRLKAERDGAWAVAPAPALAGRAAEPQIADLVAAEARLFAARRAAREGQKAQLTQRVGQLQDEISGLSAQQDAAARQSVLIAEELEGVRGLYRKNLVSLSRKAVLEREAAQLDGHKGQLVAAVAQAEGKIAETRLEIIQIDASHQEKVAQELQEVESRTAELTERRVAARGPAEAHRHPRPRVRPCPPIGGAYRGRRAVSGRARHAHRAGAGDAGSGGPGEPHRRGPAGTRPERPGEGARLQPALHAGAERPPRPHRTGHQPGPAERGDLLHRSRSGAGPQLARLAPHGVAPGMQADVFVTTSERTPLEYIVKPLRDQMAKAFRER